MDAGVHLEVAHGVPGALAFQPCSCPSLPLVLVLQSLLTSLVSSQATLIEEMFQLPL